MSRASSISSSVEDFRPRLSGVSSGGDIPSERLEHLEKVKCRQKLTRYAGPTASSPTVYMSERQPLLTYDEFYPEPTQLPPPPHYLLPPPLPDDPSFRRIITKLDLTRITDRVLALGMCWRQRSDKRSRRNNVDDLARFMNTRYPGRYMLWNLAGDTSQGAYDTAEFGNQVVSFGLSKAYALNLRTILDICRSMHAWLSIDRKHVALVQCPTGLGRAGVVIACYLRYADIFPDATEAFEQYIRRRTDGDASWATVAHRRYVQYFNHIMVLGGNIPNPNPLKLHRIVVNGLDKATYPNLPNIEIYQSGKLIFSSLINSLTPSAAGLTPSVYTDESSNIVFRISPTTQLTLSHDIQLRLFHTPDPVLNPSQLVTIASLSFHTGFMLPGVIRVGQRDLEIARNAVGTVGDDFCFFLMFSEKRVAEGKKIGYEGLVGRSLTRGLARLVGSHRVRVKEAALKALEEQGHPRILGMWLK